MVGKCEICGNIKELVDGYEFCEECEQYLFEEYELQKEEDLSCSY